MVRPNRDHLPFLVFKMLSDFRLVQTLLSLAKHSSVAAEVPENGLSSINLYGFRHMDARDVLKI
jgi:hypothetical protein